MSEGDSLYGYLQLAQFIVCVVPVLSFVWRQRRHHLNNEIIYSAKLNGKASSNIEEPSNREHLEAINEIIANGYMARKQIDRISSSPQHSMVLDSTNDFMHQVAGHTCEIIKSFSFKVLKPMVKPMLFRREIELYEEMEYLGSHCTQTAKAFVPKYYGVLNIHNETSSRPYLVLKDLTIAYKKPCAIDIKMGTQTFEPSASADKKLREHIKYSHQKSVGFRITGFKVYDAVRSQFYSVNKSFGRSLQPHQIKDGFKIFFYNGELLRRDVLFVVVQKLENILVWLKSQTKLHFFCSSILIVYDGQTSYDYRHIKSDKIMNSHLQYSKEPQSVRSTDPVDVSESPAMPTSASISNSNRNSCNGREMKSDECIDSSKAFETNESKPIIEKPKGKYVQGVIDSSTTAFNLTESSGNISTSPSPKSQDSQTFSNKAHLKRAIYRKSSPPLEDIAQVRMIDFAHTLSSEESANVSMIDEGYIIGIGNLIQYLRAIIHDIDNSLPYDGAPDHLTAILSKSMTQSLI